MVSCDYIKENKTALGYIKEVCEKLDNKEEKVCLIVPTERNLRNTANHGFKYIEILSLSSMLDTALDYDKPVLPQELRGYYLLKAVKSLKEKDRNTIFKNSGEEFLSSFLSFAQSAKNLFSFYRELFAEMVSIDDLKKAGRYSDYEQQIEVLNYLWQIYLDIIHKENYMDKWEIYQNIKINDLFIKSYNKFVFLINGFLTKFELNFIKMVGEITDVKIIFNYAGKRHQQHKQYEKFFNTESLQDKLMPLFSRDNMQIYECSSNIAQIDLITKKAYEINEKHGIPLNRMAVIMPDTSCKSYFIKLNVYNIFDISAGDDISNSRTYTLIENLFNLYSAINENLVDINLVITLLSDGYLQKNDDVKNILLNLYKLQSNNKIYITIDELLLYPFVNDYFKDIITMPKTVTIKKAISIYKNLFERLKTLILIEGGIIQECIILLEKLNIIYKNIDDLLSSSETSRLIINEISSLSIDLPKESMAVTGILETRNMDYDIVFMPYMMEDMFPPKSEKDLFINTEIRNQLLLPSYIDRENLMKDYVYQIISHAKLTVFSYSDFDSASRRSSFLEEIIINYKIPVAYYSPDTISLIHTDSIYYNYKNEDICIYKTDEIIEKLKNYKYSASSLHIFKQCSLKFYYQKIIKASPVQESVYNLNNLIFGKVLHEVLYNLYNNKISPLHKDYHNLFLKEYTKLIQEYHAYKYSNVERFVSDIVCNNIASITNAEINHAKEGFIEKGREMVKEIMFNGFKIYGIIDKLEEKDNEIHVTDYKYKDEKNIKPINKLDNFNKIDIQLPVYALLIKSSMNKLPKALYYFSLKEKFEYVDGFDLSLYDEFIKELDNLLKTIVNKDVPFTKTHDIEACRNCDYSGICGRDNGFFA